MACSVAGNTWHICQATGIVAESDLFHQRIWAIPGIPVLLYRIPLILISNLFKVGIQRFDYLFAGQRKLTGIFCLLIVASIRNYVRKQNRYICTGNCGPVFPINPIQITLSFCNCNVSTRIPTKFFCIIFKAHYRDNDLNCLLISHFVLQAEKPLPISVQNTAADSPIDVPCRPVVTRYISESGLDFLGYLAFLADRPTDNCSKFRTRDAGAWIKVSIGIPIKNAILFH